MVSILIPDTASAAAAGGYDQTSFPVSEVIQRILESPDATVPAGVWTFSRHERHRAAHPTALSSEHAAEDTVGFMSVSMCLVSTDTPRLCEVRPEERQASYDSTHVGAQRSRFRIHGAEGETEPVLRDPLGGEQLVYALSGELDICAGLRHPHEAIGDLQRVQQRANATDQAAIGELIHVMRDRRGTGAALSWLLAGDHASRLGQVVGRVLDAEADATATSLDDILERIHMARPWHPDLIFACLLRCERMRWGQTLSIPAGVPYVHVAGGAVVLSSGSGNRVPLASGRPALHTIDFDVAAAQPQYLDWQTGNSQTPAGGASVGAGGGAGSSADITQCTCFDDPVSGLHLRVHETWGRGMPVPVRAHEIALVLSGILKAEDTRAVEGEAITATRAVEARLQSAGARRGIALVAGCGPRRWSC